MPSRHPARHPAWRAALPTLWLMTDERQGVALWRALAALPRGSGVVFRHHRTAGPERSAMLAKVAQVAARRRLVLGVEIVHGDIVRVMLPWGDRGGGTAWIARARSVADGVSAHRAGAAAVFVSPVFATRTHVGQRALGRWHATAIARAARMPAIALGGVTASRYRRLRGTGFHGWAAIDGLTPHTQKRNAVPI